MKRFEKQLVSSQLINNQELFCKLLLAKANISQLLKGVLRMPKTHKVSLFFGLSMIISAQASASLPPQILTLSASPSSIYYGSQTTITWSSINTKGCKGYGPGGWSGYIPSSGSVTITLTPMKTPVTLLMNCYNSSGAFVTKSFTIEVKSTAGTGNPNASLLTDSLFAVNSFWYTPIPVDAPLHADNAAYLTDFMNQYNKYYGYVDIGINGSNSPVYLANTSVPFATVTQVCPPPFYPSPTLKPQWAQVPIPDYAIPSNDGSGDREMTIYDQATDTLWEFWLTKQISGSWTACWGGQMQNVHQNSGVWDFPYGATATGLPLIGGQITADELLRGEIKHVIGISIVATAKWTVVSSPANRSDGNSEGIIPEGTRFRLDPTINLDTLNLHPVAKIIAKAAQKYGFVVWDQAGAIAIRAENPLSYTQQGKANPYINLLAGTPTNQIFNNFPWQNLQFLP